MTQPPTGSSTPSTPTPAVTPLAPTKVDAPIGIYRIVSESFEPFEMSNGNGLTMLAKIAAGSHETDYSVSLCYGQDDAGNAVISEETEQELKQRLRDMMNKEISNPNTARLIDNRF